MTEGNRKAAGSNGLCISKNQPDPDEKQQQKKKNTDMALGTGQNFKVWCKEMWTGKLG